MLYVVPTPIGHLDDITLRALRVLSEVDLILCEDTRTSRVLLNHHGISTALKAFHMFNEHQQLNNCLSLLKQGRSIALISDAGTPGISDPGFLLVREAAREGIKYTCLPGATAIIPALVLSAFPSDCFRFIGFLPHKKGRQKAIEELSQDPQTLVVYESPHRLIKLLEALSETIPDRSIAVVREISKTFESVVRGTVMEVKAHFSSMPPKGELVVIISSV